MRIACHHPNELSDEPSEATSISIRMTLPAAASASNRDTIWHHTPLDQAPLLEHPHPTHTNDIPAYAFLLVQLEGLFPRDAQPWNPDGTISGAASPGKLVQLLTHDRQLAEDQLLEIRHRQIG